MKDSDIKKEILENLRKYYSKQTGESFKKKPEALVVEKQVSTVPLDSADSDEEETDAPAEAKEADSPALAKLKRRMGIKSAEQE
jgi:hypothetical protein